MINTKECIFYHFLHFLLFISTVFCQNESKIPNILHFTLSVGKQDLAYWTYLNIRTAILRQKPKIVYVHVFRKGDNDKIIDPTGFYWDKLMPMISLVRCRDVVEIFGRPVDKLAHKADILRMEALLEHGGIYLDADVVLLKPMTPLMNNDMVMGREAKYGLGNSVMLSSRNNSFLQRWYNEYKSFNSSFWNYHSVQLPLLLAQKHPFEITQVPEEQFFSPFYHEAKKKLFGREITPVDNQYAVHLWHSTCGRALNAVKGPDYFCKPREQNSTYTIMMNVAVLELGEC